MKLEISDSLLIVIIVFLCLLVLGLLIVIIYYRIERHLKNKLKSELEIKKSKGQEMVKKLEKAGLKDKPVQKNWNPKRDSHYKAPNNLSIEIDKEGIGISVPRSGGIMVTTTSRMRVLAEQGNEEKIKTQRLELNDSVHSDTKQPKAPGVRKIAETMDESRRDTDTNMPTPKGLNNTLDRIRNFKIGIDDPSLDIDGLEKSNLKSPKVPNQGAVYIEYKKTPIDSARVSQQEPLQTFALKEESAKSIA